MGTCVIFGYNLYWSPLSQKNTTVPLKTEWYNHSRSVLSIVAMPRVETRGSENEEESKQRCVTYELIVWIISTFHTPLPSHRSRRVHHASIDTRGNNGSL